MYRYFIAILAMSIIVEAAVAQPQTVTAIRFQGSQPDGSTVLSAEELLSAMKIRVGSSFDEEQLRQDAEAIQHLYERKGYPLARVIGFDRQPDGTLIVRIAEGRISGVRVTGNRRTRSSAILRNLQLRPGEIYSLPKLQRERERLGRLSYLKDVQIAPEPADELGQVLVNIIVDELNTTQFAAALGYTSRRGLLGYLEFSDANLLGGGQSLQLQWQRGTFYYDGGPDEGEQRQAYLLRYIDPGLTRWNLIAGVIAYNLQSVFRPSFSETDITLRTFERRQGYTLLFGKEWNDRLQMVATFRNDWVDYDDAPAYLLSFGQKALNRGRVVAAGIQMQYDSRDNRLNPRKGIWLLGGWEYAQHPWGSDFAFDRATLDVRGYWHALDGGTFALRTVAGFSTKDLPLSEGFWLGGFDLRGYEFDQFRGDRMVLLSAELRVPVLEGIQGVVFLDAGDAWRRGDSLRLNAGAGVGVRFFSPFGAIRLDIAAGRRKVFTYVTLGQSF
ncbi:MAG: BamA/TamA family outer membrane protein [Armatimonadota bacterium]|nr:BamA/TamA family outer membrane protein [bacterium]MDW8320385.1 BamA/TamA family outer membrane protein [Armatimonadota bacterium]